MGRGGWGVGGETSPPLKFPLRLHQFSFRPTHIDDETGAEGYSIDNETGAEKLKLELKLIQLHLWS
jgi:hypothetical protein